MNGFDWIECNCDSSIPWTGEHTWVEISMVGVGGIVAVGLAVGESVAVKVAVAAGEGVGGTGVAIEGAGTHPAIKRSNKPHRNRKLVFIIWVYGVTINSF